MSIWHNSKFALDGFSEALSLELNPEWNIKVTIVLPGGFRTNFRGGAVVTAPLAAYEGSPASAIRKVFADTSRKSEGDPAKAAQAIITIAHHDSPPLRLPLGKDSHGMIRAKLKAVTAELDKWQDLITSTSYDDDYTALRPEELGLQQ